MTLGTIAARAAEARGWRRRMLAFGAGLVSALAMAPFNVWPALFLTLPICIWLIDGARAQDRPIRRAAFDGWWFGFGYFLAGLWWIGAAFLVEADIFGWLLPLPVLGLPAFLALFPALGFALAAVIWSASAWRPLAFALGLGATEFLRGVVLTGFPWNAFGYALADQLWLGQAASVVGVEGLTFIALFVLSVPGSLERSAPRSRAPLAAAAILLAGLAGFGAWRLAHAEVTFRATPEIKIIQPVVARDARFRPSAGPDILDLYLRLSRESPEELGPAATDRGSAAEAAPETLLVWPESAFPFLLEQTPDALTAIGAALPPGTTLITGAARMQTPPDGGTEFYNSVMAIEGGRITQAYDKVHLVPFGEYLPFQNVMEALGVQELIRRPGGFAAGLPDQNNVFAAGLRMRPLVCYEAVFPAESVLGERPDLLLNVTDDAWFGRTPGPYQHLAIARVRSIEQGLPLVRAANSGISAIFDPYGRVLGELALDQRGVLRGRLPNPLQPTLYARVGRIMTALVVLLMAASYLFATVRRV